MRVGVHLAGYAVPGGARALPAVLGELGRACDEAGVDVLSCLDHYLQLGYLGPAEDPMLEGYTTLGFLAAHTRDVELQLLVTGVTYRHPALLAKIVSTLDVLSGGRAVLGLGASWYEREHRAYGVPFPPLRDRFVLLEETLQALRQLFSDDDGPFEGRHLRLAETLCSPQPLHPVPVMVGGVGERKTLRLVAAYADACNIFAGGAQGAAWVQGKLAVLAAHCRAEGTSYDAIRRTIAWTADVDLERPGRLLDPLRAMADVGVQEVHLMADGTDPVGFVRGLGTQLVPALHAL